MSQENKKNKVHIILTVDSSGAFVVCNSINNIMEDDLVAESICVTRKCPGCSFKLDIVLHRTIDIKAEHITKNELEQLETFVSSRSYDDLILPKVELISEKQNKEENLNDSNDSWVELEASISDESSGIPYNALEKKNEGVKVQKVFCTFCEKTYKNKKSLHIHLKLVHKLYQKIFENVDSNTNDIKKKKRRYLTKAEKEERHRQWYENKEIQPSIQDFPRQGDLICKICNKMFATTSKLKAHLRKLHNIREGKRIVTNPYKPEPGEFICPKCNREFLAPGNFGYHMKTCNPDLDYNSLTCLLCNIKCASKQKLYSHYDRTHKRKICEQCGKSFTKAQSLAEHITKHLNPEPYLCDICGVRLRSKDQVETHMMKKHLPLTCFCSQCDPPKPFAKDFQLKKHIQRVHLKVKSIPCPECPHLCKNDFDLKKHLFAKHTAPEIKNQYPCNECEFVTSTEAYLKKHKLTHLPDEQRPFKCQHCKKGFRLVYDLERHEMSHNGIRPHNCKVCGKGFITNTELKQHFIAQHTDDRPFICEICQHGHKDRWAYRNHLTAHERQLGITLDKSIGKFMHKYKDLQL